MKDYTRIAIITHETHQLYIEDIPNDILENQYNGDEQAYIDDNYSEIGDYSWDYIIGVEYMSSDADADFTTIKLG